jgi:hypothetical protein
MLQRQARTRLLGEDAVKMTIPATVSSLRTRGGRRHY